MVAGPNIVSPSLEVNLMDDSNCAITSIEEFYPKMISGGSNFVISYIYEWSFQTTAGREGPIAAIIYIPIAGFYTFSSTQSGTTVTYSSTLNGTYSSFGSVANSSLSASKAGYYKFLGSPMTIHIKTSPGFFIDD